MLAATSSWGLLQHLIFNIVTVALQFGSPKSHAVVFLKTEEIANEAFKLHGSPLEVELIHGVVKIFLVLNLFHPAVERKPQFYFKWPGCKKINDTKWRLRFLRGSPSWRQMSSLKVVFFLNFFNEEGVPYWNCLFFFSLKKSCDDYCDVILEGINKFLRHKKKKFYAPKLRFNSTEIRGWASNQSTTLFDNWNVT